MKKKIISTFMILTIATTLLSGCKDKNGNTPSIIPKKERKAVKIVSDIDGDYLTEYLDVFSSKHPDVKLDIVTSTAKNIQSKLRREKGNADIDIVFGYSAINAVQLDKEGLLLSYKSSEYDKLKANFKSDKSTPTWAPVSAYTPVITYNKNNLDKEKLPVPTKFSDLANDIYDGFFVIPDLDKTPMGNLIESVVEKEVGKDKKEEVLKKLRSNAYASEMQYAKTAAYLNEYKVPIAILPDFEGLFSQWDDVNMKVVYAGKDTLIGDIETVALVKKTEVNEDAKVLMDWFLSEQAMNLYKKNRSMISREGIKTIMEKAPEELDKQIKFFSR